MYLGNFDQVGGGCRGEAKARERHVPLRAPRQRVRSAVGEDASDPADEASPGFALIDRRNSVREGTPNGSSNNRHRNKNSSSSQRQSEVAAGEQDTSMQVSATRKTEEQRWRECNVDGAVGWGPPQLHGEFVSASSLPSEDISSCLGIHHPSPSAAIYPIDARLRHESEVHPVNHACRLVHASL